MKKKGYLPPNAQEIINKVRKAEEALKDAHKRLEKELTKIYDPKPPKTN